MTLNTKRRGNTRVGAVPPASLTTRLRNSTQRQPETISEVIEMLRLALSKPSPQFPHFAGGFEAGFRAGTKHSIEVLEALQNQSNGRYRVIHSHDTGCREYSHPR